VESGRVDLHPEQAVEMFGVACMESLRGSGLPNSTVIRELFSSRLVSARRGLVMKGCWRNVLSVALNAASYRLPLIVAYLESARQCRGDDDCTRTRGLWRANIEKITVKANCKTNPLAGH